MYENENSEQTTENISKVKDFTLTIGVVVEDLEKAIESLSIKLEPYRGPQRTEQVNRVVEAEPPLMSTHSTKLYTTLNQLNKLRDKVTELEKSLEL